MVSTTLTWSSTILAWTRPYRAVVDDGCAGSDKPIAEDVGQQTTGLYVVVQTAVRSLPTTPKPTPTMKICVICFL